MQHAPIVRHSLVDQACDRLREEIVRGHLAPDSRVTETDLATRLGISRTPLRAAIARLSAEGFLHLQQGRGIRVAPANAQAVREIYPILGALDGLAVRLAVEQGDVDVVGLRRTNREIKKGVSRARLFELDREFHRGLRAACPNRRVLELVESHLRLAARFDGAASRGMHAIESSRAAHEAILTSVEAERAAEAGRRVEAHWLEGIAVVVDWLGTQADGNGGDHASR